MAIEQDEEITDGKGGLRAYLTSLEKKLNAVHASLIGSEIGQDGGLVYRVVSLEMQVKLAIEKIAKLEKEGKEEAFFRKIIWGTGGIILAALAAAIFNHYIK